MPVKIGASYVSEVAAEYAKTERKKREEAESSNEKSSVLSKLQEKFPGLSITIGTKPFSGAGKSNLSISPKILKEMEKDPEKREEYEALIYDVANLSGSDWARGRKLKSHGVIIGDDGGLRGWSISEYDDGNRRHVSPLDRNDKKSWFDKMLGNFSKKKKSSRLKEEQEKLLERRREAAKIEISKEGKAKLEAEKEKSNSLSFADVNELSKYLFQNYDVVKGGMANISSKYLRDSLKDSDKLSSLLENLSAADKSLRENQGKVGFQGMKITIDEKGEVTMESSSGRVGFNGEKIKRIIAAAATRDDMRIAIKLLEEDIEELENGLKNNMCDEAEVQKAKDMMSEAKQKLSSLPDRAPTLEEQTALSVNMVV